MKHFGILNNHNNMMKNVSSTIITIVLLLYGYINATAQAISFKNTNNSIQLSTFNNKNFQFQYELADITNGVGNNKYSLNIITNIATLSLNKSITPDIKSSIQQISVMPANGIKYAYTNSFNFNSKTNFSNNDIKHSFEFNQNSSFSFSSDMAQNSIYTNNQFVSSHNTKNISSKFNPSKQLNALYTQHEERTKTPSSENSKNSENFIIDWAISPFMNINYTSDTKSDINGNIISNSVEHDIFTWNWKIGDTHAGFINESTNTIKNNISTEQQHKLITIDYPGKNINVRFKNEDLNISQLGNTTQQNIQSIAFLIPSKQYQIGLNGYQSKSILNNNVTKTSFYGMTFDYQSSKTLVSHLAFDQANILNNNQTIIQGHYLINLQYTPYNLYINSEHRTNCASRDIINDLLTLNNTWNGIKLDLMYSNVDDGMQNTIGTITRLARIESNQNNKNNFIIEKKTISTTNGTDNDTLLVNANYQLSNKSNVNLNVVNSSSNDIKSQTDTIKWNYEAGKTESISGMTVINSTNTDTSAAITNSIAVSNTIHNNIQVVGSHSVTNKGGDCVAAQSNVAIANHNPMPFILKDSVFAFKYNSAMYNGYTQSQSIDGIIRGRIGGSLISLGYNNMLDIKGNKNIIRSFEISNTQPNSHMNYSLLYRARDINNTISFVEQNHNISLKLSPNCEIMSNYSVLPAIQNSYITARTSTTSAKYRLNKYVLSFNYGNILNPIQKIDTSRYALTLSGNINKNIPIRVGYAYDRNNNENISGHTLLFDYSHKLNPDDILSINLAYTINEGRSQNYIILNLEVKTKW